MGHFRRLVGWRRAFDLCVEVNAATGSFPEEERFGLTAQLRRAAVSVASNVAEGSGRASPAQFPHAVRIARGSLHQLATQLQLAQALGLLPAADWQRLDASASEVGRLLTGLLRCPPKRPTTND